MRFLSLFSGIEAASVAWKPLGWKAAAVAEIEPFPCAVLAHHYPDVPNLGDVTKYKEWPDLGTVDVVCGGSPCQSFSVAGLRQGLADPRGNLSLTFLAVVDKYRPRYVVWENVPGVLSSNGGRDFASFLGGLGQLGYGWSYRVLDAQYARVDGFPYAVPQRRRRVVVVGYLGDWRRAAAVLSEPESVLGDTPPSRKAGERPAPTIARRPSGGGGLGTDFDCDGGLIPYHVDPVASCVTRGFAQRIDAETENFVAYTLKGEGADASEDGTGRGTPVVAFGLSNQPTPKFGEEISPSLDAKQNGGGRMEAVAYGSAVRRLTPMECARLQGFPDDYLTQVEWRGKTPPADGPMYKALGNSWAVNVFRWVGYRIEMVEEIAKEIAA